jgi:hypothetical protein
MVRHRDLGRFFGFRMQLNRFNTLSGNLKS